MVIAVRSNGLRVFVPKFGIEGSITLFREPREGEPAARNPYKFDEEVRLHSVWHSRGSFGRVAALTESDPDWAWSQVQDL